MAQFVANRCHVPIRREVTDTLVDLLIDMIHHVGFKAEQRATKELVDEITRVANKMGILRRMAETALDHPDGIIGIVRLTRQPAQAPGGVVLSAHEYTVSPSYKRHRFPVEIISQLYGCTFDSR